MLARRVNGCTTQYSSVQTRPFQHSSSLYDFTVKDANGQDFNLVELKDKKAVLIVNVASQCEYDTGRRKQHESRGHRDPPSDRGRGEGDANPTKMSHPI